MLNAIIITSLCIVIYVMYMNHKMVPFQSMHYQDIKPNLKTGDLILFHALNNYYAPIIGSYYTHIGIVYRGPYTNDEPYIFEAAAVKMMPFYGGDAVIKNENGCGNGKGIMFSKLEERLQRYMGYMMYKPLAGHVDADRQENFPEFIEYCMKNMYYNYTPFRHSVGKFIEKKPCGYETNCGEIVFLSMIRLGLLKTERYHDVMLHYLRYVCDLQDLDYGNRYEEPLCCITYDPF